MEKAETNSKANFSCGHLHMYSPELTMVYIHHLCTDTGCRVEDMIGTRDCRDIWRERAKEMRSSSSIDDTDERWYVPVVSYFCQ